MAAAELDATDVDILKKKPRPNNPEEAEEFIKQVKIAVDKFAEMIHSYESYKIKDTYTDFVTRYYELLANIEDYFKDGSILALLVHYTLHQKLFDKFKESQSNVADHFLVQCKKLLHQ